MDDFCRLTKTYSAALQKTLECNEHLRTILIQITACREVLKAELGVGDEKCVRFVVTDPVDAR